MFALLALIGLGTFAIVHHVRKTDQRSIAVQGIARIPRAKHPTTRSAIATLARFTRARMPVPTALLNDALAEAYDRGDVRIIAAITNRLPIAPQAQSPVDVETSGEETTQLVIGRNSPIDGVSNDEWESFVDKLKTQTADYSTEKHIGAYHHHRERLQQLGLNPEELTDEDSQYHALAKDVAAYASAERKLIADFGGELIELPGTTASNADGSNVHCVTMSGVLGVVKAAGPKNARSWFKNPEDRASHPHTTETFLRTNGLF